MNDHTQHVEDAVRAAVVSGNDLYQQVRDITLKALTERELDMDNIKSVVQAVGKGIGSGISHQNKPAKTAFKQSVDALDDALGQTAEASRLAIEEAASRISEFSSHDLNQATEDIKNLEEMFLETISNVARESNETVFDIAEDFIAHARNSGTSVGRQTQSAMQSLNQLRQIGQETILTNTAATSSALAQIASGILSGIAESLHPKKSNS